MSRNVLVPVDGSPMADRALEHVLANLPNADVTVLFVVDYVEESYAARALVGREELVERGQERAAELFEVARETAAEYDRSIDTATAVGKPAREIVAYAEDEPVDQIVIGSHGRSSVSRVLLGSVAETVVRRAPCPVCVVR